MIQCRNRLWLALEPMPPLCVHGQQRRKHLDRDFAVKPGVLSDVDLADSLTPEGRL
jgi:hypothetical protein